MCSLACTCKALARCFAAGSREFWRALREKSGLGSALVSDAEHARSNFHVERRRKQAFRNWRARRPEQRISLADYWGDARVGPASASAATFYLQDPCGLSGVLVDTSGRKVDEWVLPPENTPHKIPDPSFSSSEQMFQFGSADVQGRGICLYVRYSRRNPQRINLSVISADWTYRKVERRLRVGLPPCC